MKCCKCHTKINRTNTVVYTIGDKALCTQHMQEWAALQHAAWKDWLND